MLTKLGMAMLISVAATHQVLAGHSYPAPPQVPEIDGSGALAVIALMLGVGTILFKSARK